MLVTTHAASGALLARAARLHPKASVAGLTVAGLISHYGLDALPHWGFSGHADVKVGDRAFLAVAIPDGLASLALLGVLGRRAFRSRQPTDLAMFLTAGAATLPDVNKPAVLFFGRSPFPAWHERFHQDIQREHPRLFRRDVAVAAGLAVLALVPRSRAT